MTKKVNQTKHIKVLSNFPLFIGNRSIFINEGKGTCHLYDSIGIHKLKAPTLKKLNKKAKDTLDDLANSLREQEYGKK